MGLTKIEIPAQDIRVGDATGSSGKSRVASVLLRSGKVYVRIETRGARTPTIEIYSATTRVTMWRSSDSQISPAS